MAAKSCVITPKSNVFTDAIKKAVGDNTVMFFNIYNGVTLGKDFIKEFKEWYKSKTKHDLNLTDKNANKIAERAIQWYRFVRPTISSFARKDRSNQYVDQYGYPSLADREDGKTHVANIILYVFNNILNKGLERNNSYKDYLGQVKNAWDKYIFNYISTKTGKTVEEIKQEYNDAQDKASYIKNNIGDTVTSKNLYAVYQELNGSEEKALDYLMEVFWDFRLQDVTVKEREIEENGVNNGGESALVPEDDYDYSYASMDHSGTYTNFMKHISSRLRLYFNNLPKLASIGKINGKPDYDKNNRFGLADRMDANACITMLFNNGVNFTSVNAMIASIDRIGRTVDGFAAFVIFAEDLRKDLNLAYEVRTVFTKAIMKKMRADVTDGEAKMTNSNQAANRQNKLYFDLVNDTKTSIIDIEPSIIDMQIRSINGTLNTLSNFDTIDDKTSKRFVQPLIRNVIKLVRQCYPSAQAKAIEGYIYNNETTPTNIKGINDNIKSILNIINQTKKESEISKKAYNSQLVEIRKARAINDKRKKDIDNGVFVKEEEIDLSKIYGKEYITAKQKTIAMSLAKLLLDYSVVNTNFNSPNTKHNQSSDIINSSLLTKLCVMFTKTTIAMYDKNGNITDNKKEAVRKVIDNPALIALGTERFKSRQYDNSTILLEHRDEAGNIINRGIFKYVDVKGNYTTDRVNGTLTITDYADQLLDLSLFDGATNNDESLSASYSEMTKGDFMPTQFIGFFGSQPETFKEFNLANYFLRTPADALKTFCIRAPRYSTAGLVTLADKVAHEQNLIRIINSFGFISPEEAKEYKSKSNIIANNKYREENKADKSKVTTTEESLRNAIVGHRGLIIEDLRGVKVVDDVAYANILTLGENGQPNKKYIIKGKLTKTSNGGNILRETELVGILDISGDERRFSSNIETLIKGYYNDKLMAGNVTVNGQTFKQSKKTINKEHPVFKMIKQHFKQEMLDAAVALNHYFDLDANGCVSVEADKKTPKLRKDKSRTKGYKFYHLGENGDVLTPIKDDDGNIVAFSLGGNIFHSNKFTLDRVINGKRTKVNYLERVLSNEMCIGREDGLIHILYGGRENKKLGIEQAHLKIIFDSDDVETRQVQDIEFSKAQHEEIDKALNQYILDYIEDSKERVEPYKNFITGVTVNEDNITEFALNNLLMHYSFDELFEGNTKFYKDTQTILKRAKEHQGSGVPLGHVNYDESESEPMHDVESALDDESLQSLFDRNELGVLQDNGHYRLGLRNKFKAVTVKNSQTTNKKGLKAIIDVLSPHIGYEEACQLIYGKNVRYDQNSEPIIDKKTGGFANTKVNDAQSYITLDEFIRRVAAKGQLSEYRKLIEALLDESKPISAETLTKFVQVQKNFYYDTFYDEDYGIIVPRQIKNAEFVLIPRLIKGTQLEEVYKMMKKAGIDQLNTVETSKAANEEILELWDNDGNISEETYGTFVDKAKNAAKDYNYASLYVQQETQQHANAKNKAGIQIVKKIIDNLPKGDSRKQAFFDNFCQNIKESFEELADNFELVRDENGNLVINDDGTIETINSEIFYYKLRQEMLRLGLDSNMLDYVTIEYGAPKMPPIATNVLRTFESVVQSVFNNNITRQKLPGFHAAQVTNIGFRALSEQGIEGVTYDKELQYHPVKNGKAQGYIEVKVPASFFGIDRNSSHYNKMSDEEILKELQDSELDMVIGYRIPTEGKQSVCNMKVVGILSDAYGSTIVVPNDWVSQTGSDFDIDSVYGIQWETYKDKTGKLTKIEYIDSTLKDYDLEELYFRYVRSFDRNFDSRLKNKVKDKYNKAKKEEIDDYLKICDSESVAFNDFIRKCFADKKARQTEARTWSKIAVENSQEASGLDLHVRNIQDYINRLKEYKEGNHTQEQIDAADNLINHLSVIYSKLTGRKVTLEGFRDKALEEAMVERMEDAERRAKDKGAKSFEEFKDAFINNPQEINNRRARNNRILKAMEDILLDENNLEENVSRSNYDDIAEILDMFMDPNVKAQRENRSPYNVFDQMDFQEEAMSGVHLKALSVTLDTFCSVCNVVKPTLAEAIEIEYDAKDFKDAKKTGARYDTKPKKGKLVIKHNQYGWSKDYRNIEGRILTAYSSQTTAYILDAIKIGAIPNVNDYTFGAFKTLLNVGANYKAALTFIMQPGVSEIIRAYNAKESIYSSSNDDTIHSAVKSIAKQLGIQVKFGTTLDKVLDAISEKYSNQFNDIFGGKKGTSISMKRVLPIKVSEQVDRLQGKGQFSETSPVENKLLFDLGTIIAFNRIRRIGNRCSDIARVCNPDKFGAKQTVFSTNKVFDDIKKILHKEVQIDENSSVEEDRKSILEVDGKNILEAIYPGCSEGLNAIIKENRIKDSKYPSLYSFLKYASATSIAVSRTLLPTQNPLFVGLINDLKDYFSAENRELDEETYIDFQNYILNALYNTSCALQYNTVAVLTKNGFEIKADTESIPDDETMRVYGYGHSPAIAYYDKETRETDKGNVIEEVVFKDFTVEDINKISQDEINHFCKLSPAQKVKWIQRNFSEPGVFGLIDVQTYNDKRRGYRAGMQTLEFVEQTNNPNVIYNLFNEAFFSTNPLITLAAIDVIKYAFKVEGFTMRKNGVSKVISNDSLLGEFSAEGLGIMGETMDLISEGFVFTEVYENYLRSHPTTTKIKGMKMYKSNIEKAGLHTLPKGMYRLITEKETPEQDIEDARKRFDARCARAGVKSYLVNSQRYVLNPYTRLGDILYKVEQISDDEIILYPLNTLERNENSEFSANPKNNKYPKKRFYDELIKTYRAHISDVRINAEYVNQYVQDLKDKGEYSQYTYSRPKDFSKFVEPKEINLETDAETYGSSASFLRDKVLYRFNASDTGALYVRSSYLAERVFAPGHPGEFSLRTTKYGYRTFIVEKLDVSKQDKYYLQGEGDPTEIKNSDIRDIYVSAKSGPVEGRLQNIKDLYKITPKTEVSAMDAQLEETNAINFDYIRMLRDSNSDPLSVETIEKFRINDINGSPESMALNPQFATREIAAYATKSFKKLKKDFQSFIEIPGRPDEYYDITSPEVQQMILKDEKLLNRYLRTISEVRALQDVLRKYKEVEFKTEDSEIRDRINDILKVVEELEKLPLEIAEENFARGYAKTISTNPLVQDDMIDILKDGYYRNYGLMWQFHDIAENGNPLVQTILTNVANDIEKKRMAQVRHLNEFRSAVQSIISEAKANGHTVDWNKIIGPDGRFKEDWTAKFTDTLYDLRAKKDEAAKSYGYGSIEHLKAKNEYDLFKAHYVNQEARPAYYITKANNEKRMIENYPVIYEEYMKLHYQELDLYNHLDSTGINEEVRKKLQEIHHKMANLTQHGFYIDDSGEVIDRPYKEEGVTYTGEREREILLYGREVQEALSTFLSVLKDGNRKYFKYDSAFGFEETLNKNLRIVEAYEDRKNGVPTRPMSELEQIPSYIEARNWIRDNAYFEPVINTDGQETTIGSRLKWTKDYLRLGRSGKSDRAATVMFNHADGEGIYDERRIPDGTRLSDDERRAIKQAQEENFQNEGMPIGTDRVLINSVGHKTIYKPSFYAKLSGNNENVLRAKNPKYLEYVTKINKILEKFYDPVDGIVHFDRIDDDSVVRFTYNGQSVELKGIDILHELGTYYQLLRAYQQGGEMSQETKDWIAENVEFKPNRVAITSQKNAMQFKGQEWYDAYLKVAFERNADGEFVVTKDGKVVPNRKLYTVAKPKGQPGDPNYDKWVDAEHNEALNLIHTYYRKVPTKYYYQAQSEALRRAQNDPSFDYEQWYIDNHVYNPYTRQYQPIDCWITSELRYELFEEGVTGNWVPKRNQRQRVVNDGTITDDESGIEVYDETKDMRNHDYDPSKGLVGNYRKGNGVYDNNHGLNEYEVKLRDYLKNVLEATAHTNASQTYFAKGYAPAQLKGDDVNMWKEFSKMLGFNVSTDNGRKEWYEEIGFEHDITPLMPMTKQLNSKDPIKISEAFRHPGYTDEKVKEFIDKALKSDKTIIPPSKEQFEGFDKKYEDAKKIYEEYEDEIKEHNRKIHESLLDTNWQQVIENYLNQAARYNAVQDNKLKLYYLLNMVKRQQTYMRKFGGTGPLKVDTRRSTDNNTVYETSIDNNLVKQLENHLRRVMFDQWRQPEDRLTRVANNLQGFTSANYMMLNIRGGIANVTLGKTGIFAESMARDYFEASDMNFASKEYWRAVTDFAAHMYDEKSGTKQDAIIKFFITVDYDEVTGVSREVDMTKRLERLRNLMFSPQTMGEHYMQNRVLFAMLHSHKLIALDNDPTGVGYTSMNKEEYIRYRQRELLDDILSEDQMREFNDFIANIKKDKNKLKDYAWWRKDVLTEWIYLHTDNKQQEAFKKARKEQREAIIKEFEEKNNLYDQIELGDNGLMSFKAGSDLAMIHEKIGQNNVSAAESVLGALSERVRKVNNKIHGVYNRNGAAYIEKEWYGALVMQYHKHLPMGLLKRYRARGIYSESRGTVEKGMVQSFADFMSLNFRKMKSELGLADDQLTALEGLQFMSHNLFNFFLNTQRWSNTWNMMPEYDRANIRRNLGDAVGVLAALMTTIALLFIRDDKNKDSIALNLALYEADRLASEAFMYNPIGLITEVKTLMSTPIAAQSIINDGAQTLYELGKFIMEGEDYDPIYKSGRFAGRNRYSVYVQRRIPGWAGIRAVIDSPANNQAYKIGDTAGRLFPTKDVVDWLKN